VFSVCKNRKGFCFLPTNKENEKVVFKNCSTQQENYYWKSIDIKKLEAKLLIEKSELFKKQFQKNLLSKTSNQKDHFWIESFNGYE
jgi:hypothetical protein